MLTLLERHKRAIIIISVVVLLLFAAFMSFAIYSARTLFESGKATPTATQYSEWVGIWLPENVQNFQAYGEGWQDWLVEARFEIPASELAKFLERNKLQQSDLESDLESSYKLEWFSATAKLEQYEIKPLPDQAAQTATGFYPSFWLDKTNSDRVIVYIKAFDT